MSFWSSHFGLATPSAMLVFRFWTLSWYGDASVLKQVDFILIPIGLESSCVVDYRLDCRSDHRPIICKASGSVCLPRQEAQGAGN